MLTAMPDQSQPHHDIPYGRGRHLVRLTNCSRHDHKQTQGPEINLLLLDPDETVGSKSTPFAAVPKRLSRPSAP